MRLQLRAELSLALIAMVWGMTFVMVKQALDDISTLLFLAIRFTAATLLLACVFRKRMTISLWTPIEWRGGALAGFLLLSGYVLQTFGLKYTTAGKSGFLTGLNIVFVPILTALIYRKLPQLSEFTGILLATVGMALMTVAGLKFSIGIGDLLTIGCAVVYAGHMIVLGYYSQRASFERLVVLQMGVSAVLAGATCWWIEPPHVRWNSNVLVALAVTSVFATALAFTIQTWAQRYTTPTRTALIFSTEPVFALGTSVLVAGEALSPRALAGAASILLGILFVELKPLRFGRHPSTKAADSI